MHWFLPSCVPRSCHYYRLLILLCYFHIVASRWTIATRDRKRAPTTILPDPSSLICEIWTPPDSLHLYSASTYILTDTMKSAAVFVASVACTAAFVAPGDAQHKHVQFYIPCSRMLGRAHWRELRRCNVLRYELQSSSPADAAEIEYQSHSRDRLPRKLHAVQRLTAFAHIQCRSLVR